MAKAKDARRVHRESIISAIFRSGSGPHKSMKREGGRAAQKARAIRDSRLGSERVNDG